MKKILLILFIPLLSYAQKDVTQFFDIPVDGFKPQMINKIKSKGYTISKEYEDALEGEFNGEEVIISIQTINNKVWRVSLLDKYTTDEINIKIRFNKLIQQFQNNERYITEADSIISKYTIPKKEDIGYQIKVNKKRYDAAFFQKSLKYDSIKNETDLLKIKLDSLDNTKELISEEEGEKNLKLLLQLVKERINSENKRVWFMIDEEYGKYRILMFYENGYNEAKGKGL
jgi:uncharacterized protein (UPF0333 family)